MINSILTIVNNIITYVTNNSDVFKVAFILAIVTTITSGIPFDIILGDIPNILIVFICSFVFFSFIMLYLLM